VNVVRSRGRQGFTRWIACVVFLTGSGILLVACGNGAATLAREACSHINLSLTLYAQASAQPPPVDATALDQQAYAQLQVALPLAARAAVQDGRWEALMTTLSESNRAPESDLVNALQNQCSAASQAGAGQPPPPPPTSIPPPTSNPAAS
jgi:hypothetical protein